MVLELLINPRKIEKKNLYAFIIGVFYSFIGIILAVILFPADPSLVAVAFTSILLLPVLRKLFSIEEKQEKKEKSFSFKHLIRDEGDFIKTYLLIAAGIFIVYSISSIILPEFAVNSLFREQLELRGAGAVGNGGAIFSESLFSDIISNNFIVLFYCVLLSFMAGDGAIFLITWNASLWGSIFGVVARNASVYAHTNPFLYFLLVMIIVLPHASIEMLSYILGGIGGGLISSDFEVESGERKKDRFKKIFYNYTGTLLLSALILLIIGALIETFVLNNITIYSKIVSYSYMIG